MAPEVLERMRLLWDAADKAIRSDVSYAIEVEEAINIYAAKREASALLGADARRANRHGRQASASAYVRGIWRSGNRGSSNSNVRCPCSEASMHTTASMRRMHARSSNATASSWVYEVSEPAPG